MLLASRQLAAVKLPDGRIVPSDVISKSEPENLIILSMLNLVDHAANQKCVNHQAAVLTATVTAI